MVTCRPARVGWAAAAAAPALAWAVAHLTAPAVRTWQPGGGGITRAGPLSVRRLGGGHRVVLLLHGLLSSQAQFGNAYDRVAETSTVVAPDLLGFGASLDEHRDDLGLDAHLDALDAALSALDLKGRPTIVAGHSLGSLLALHWASRHPANIEAVVGWCPPLYRNRSEAFAGIGRSGPFIRALSTDGPLPRRLCAWNCRHRRAAGWLDAALSPGLPIPVTRAASHHTWEAYRGALDDIIMNPTWESALDELARDQIPVRLISGVADRVLVEGRADDVAAHRPTVTHESWVGDHHLPLTLAPQAVTHLVALTTTPR